MPVGSTRLVQRILAEAGAPIEQIGVASNPEFLREGSSVRDFLQPNRVVIGCDDPSVAVRVSELYRSLNAPILVTDPASAEMIKYASNAFLATKISFVNAIANLCEAVDADVREVALGMGYDQRIGFEFLHPGPGLRRLVLPEGHRGAALRGANAPATTSRCSRAWSRSTGASTSGWSRRCATSPAASLDGVPIALWGLTFKANTDDLRDSPALVIARRLLEEGATVRAYDPAAGSGRPTLVPGLEVVADPYDACEGAAVLAVLTEWDEFRWLDFDRVAAALAAARGARRPQPARPGRAAAPGLHLRGRRPLVDDAPRRRADRPPAAAGGRHRRGRLPRLAPLRAAHRHGLGRRRARQPPHRAHGEHRGPARPARVHVRALRRHELHPRHRRRSTRCCTSRAPRARRTTSSTRSRR